MSQDQEWIGNVSIADMATEYRGFQICHLGAEIPTSTTIHPIGAFMMLPVPHHVNERQSDLRGVKEGWYAIDDRGRLLFGPFSVRQKCLGRIYQSVVHSDDVQASGRLNK